MEKATPHSAMLGPAMFALVTDTPCVHYQGSGKMWWIDLTKLPADESRSHTDFGLSLTTSR